jgi:hypothetical protein
MADPLVSILAPDRPVGWPDRSPAWPTVQLLHTLPDGSAHVDWMIGSAEASADLPVLTFRLPQRLEELKPGLAVPITRMPDHRRAYLDYEGPVSSGRGEVLRISRGAISQILRSANQGLEEWTLTIQWEGSSPAGESGRVALRQQSGSDWLVEKLSICQRSVYEWSQARASADHVPIGSKER